MPVPPNATEEVGRWIWCLNYDACTKVILGGQLSPSITVLVEHHKTLLYIIYGYLLY